MKKIFLFLFFLSLWTIGNSQTILGLNQMTNDSLRRWNVTGNSGTTAGTNFVGNTDSVDLVFKTNNTERARIAGNGVFSTTKDIFANGVMVGEGGGSIISNTSIGYQSLIANSSGTFNTSIGYQSLAVNGIGTGNTSMGYQSMMLNTAGNSNTSIGRQALLSNIVGNSNNAFGRQALSANTQGSFNNAIGHVSLASNTTGGYNSVFGFQGGQYLKTGSKNTIIGYGSTYIKSAVLDSSLNNTVVLGTYDDIRIYSDSTQRTGIGTTTPLAKLHINGDLIVSTTASGASTDSIMTINASGNVRKRNVSDVINSNSITANTTFTAPIAAGGEGTVNATLTGVAIGDVVHYTLGATDLPVGIVVKSIRVSAANTVVLTLSNTTAGALSPNVTVYFKKQ